MVRRRSLQSILRSAGAQETLKIGQPNDKYEQEADSVADRVMSMPDSQLQRQPDNKEEEEKLQARPLADQITPLVQRQEDTKEEEEPVQAKLGDGEIAQRQPAGNEEEEEPLQTKSSTGESSVATPDIESGINSLKSGGQPLDPATRSFFEPRFGRDFSHVRLHTDSTAADTARSIHARAFTIGNHVAMGSGEYQPNSQSGQRLLGHELTHVVQQVGQRPTSSVARVIQRQSPATAQPTLTQQLYNQAIASIASRSGVNTTLLAILRRGQVGRRTAGVHSASSTLTIPPPAGSTAGSTSVPAVRVIFDLEISPATTQLPQGAFAFF